MSTLHAFVISWAGQHDKAAAIAAAITGVADRVGIVFSDPVPDRAPRADCDLIRRPNELYWGDKFRACLDAFAGDFLLVIHADCQCADWAGLVSRCRTSMQGELPIGAWAPDIRGANLDKRVTHVADLIGTPFVVVTQTDALVFALSRPVVERMKQANYERNLYGWGIDDMAAAFCFTRGLLVVVDSSVLVEHPISSGYSKEEAQRQKSEFMQQLTFLEAIQHRLLWACLDSNHAKYLRQVNSNGPAATKG